MEKAVDLGSLLSGTDDNIVQTPYATLFVEEEVKEETVRIDSRDWHKASGQKEVKIQQVDPVKNFTLYYTGFAHEGAEAHELYNVLRTGGTDASTLSTRISSPGGYVTEGMQLVSLAREVFSGRWVTYLEAGAASMGAVSFAAGDKRIAYDHSSFMLHDFQSADQNNGGNIFNRINHTNKWIDRFFRSILVDTNMITEDEYQRMKDGRELYMECEEMVIRGIATDVIVGEYVLNGEAYLEFLEYGVPVKEYIEMIKAEDGEEIVLDNIEDIQKFLEEIDIDELTEDE